MYKIGDTVADDGKSGRILHSVLLVLRLGSLSLLCVLLTIHVRSLRLFRWEQSVSGGLLVTYTVAMLGLVLLSGLQNEGARAFQVYMCATGAVSMAANAAVIYNRWRRAGDLARALAELLSALGLPLQRQLVCKVVLSAVIAAALLADLVICTLN